MKKLSLGALAPRVMWNEGVVTYALSLINVFKNTKNDVNIRIYTIPISM